MVGITIPISATQCLLPEDKHFDRHPVSFGIASDHESTLVSGHYAVALSGVAVKRYFYWFARKAH